MRIHTANKRKRYHARAKRNTMWGGWGMRTHMCAMAYYGPAWVTAAGVVTAQPTTMRGVVYALRRAVHRGKHGRAPTYPNGWGPLYSWGL